MKTPVTFKFPDGRDLTLMLRQVPRKGDVLLFGARRYSAGEVTWVLPPEDIVLHNNPRWDEHPLAGVVVTVVG